MKEKFNNMKTLISSLLILASFTGFALPNPTNNPEKRATVKTEVSAEPSLAAQLKMLREEIARLRMDVESLMQVTDELSSKLEFEKLMGNMTNLLNSRKHLEKLDEMEAMLQYNRMMANMMLKLNSERAGR
jgi:hypothetical protein